MDKAAEATGKLSPSAYARRRGVTHHAVMQRIEAGSMPTAATRVGQRWLLDPDLADAEWAAHTQPRVPGAAPGSLPGAGSAGAPSGLAVATERERNARADALELDLAKKKGLLVPAADVERLATDMVVQARTALLGLPTRFRQRCPHLTAGDLTVLDLLLREVLEEMADAASRLTV